MRMNKGYDIEVIITTTGLFQVRIYGFNGVGDSEKVLFTFDCYEDAQDFVEMVIGKMNNV